MTDAGEKARSEAGFDALLARVLSTGVIISALVVACGGARLLLSNSGDRPDYRVFVGEPAEFRTVGGVMAEALKLTGPGLIQLGLLFLIATPIARVLFSILGFARNRDWLYVGIASVVLALLAYSLTTH